MKILSLLFQLYLILPGPVQDINGSPSLKATPTYANDLDFVKSPSDSIQYKLIESVDHSYGYDIYLKGRLLIHQPTIPSLKGTKGFQKKEEARKVALLVIEKIRKGIMPPTITLEEMKSVGVIFF